MLGGVFAGYPAISPATAIENDINAISIDAAIVGVMRVTGGSILKLSGQGLIIAFRTTLV
jgi:hypothetical protein